MSVDLLFSASEYSQPTGKIVFLGSCIVVCFNFFITGIVPQVLIIPAYSLLSTSLIGVVYFNLKYHHTPHLAMNDCPQCGSKMKYSGLKCLDEHKKGCQFSSKFK